MILGLDIGGTKSAVVLGTAQGEIHWRTQFATAPERGFRPVFDDLVQAAQEGVQRSLGTGLQPAGSAGEACIVEYDVREQKLQTPVRLDRKGKEDGRRQLATARRVLSCR
jgi:predicted NBD/HSP70 family sugar kinase